MAYHCCLVYAVGLTLFSIAGTGMQFPLIFAVPGLLLFCGAHTVIPALQALLQRQYSMADQGAVSGIMSQQQKLAYGPAYCITLCFSYSLRNRDDAVIFWPGSAHAVCVFVILAACYFHYQSYGKELCTVMHLRVCVPEGGDLAVTLPKPLPNDSSKTAQTAQTEQDSSRSLGSVTGNGSGVEMQVRGAETVDLI